MMMPTFTGGAYFTDVDKFKKIAFSEMAKEPLSKTTKDGWAGIIQHYLMEKFLIQPNH
jgi:YidC/Oxa1 family membrane protein insertase